MIDEKYLELIQADVDGELPDRDRAELSRFMLANPDAHAVRDELKRLCSTLDKVRQVEPPPELRTSILAAVPLQAAAAGARSQRSFLAQSGALRYAAAFAAGTMVSQDPVSRSGPVDSVRVSLDQVSGTVSFFRSSSMRVVEFDLAAREPVEVAVVHDGQEARFSGFGQSGGAAAQRYALVLDGPGVEGAPIEIRFLSAGAVIHRESLKAPPSNRE
jgi:anti-sigma factor RsiW